MALFDWNHDGKKNHIDNMMEYEARMRSRAACEKEREQKAFNRQFEPSSSSSDTSGCSWFFWFIVIIVILAILGVR